MGEQQEFCLRWNDFHSNFHLSLAALRNDESFTDVTLSCSGRLLRGHRVILSACSSHFKQILREVPRQQHPVIVLPTVDFDVMRAILEFIYQGQVNVRQSQLGAFLQVAETFSIQGLSDDTKKQSSKRQSSSGSAPAAASSPGGVSKRRRTDPPSPPPPPAQADRPPAAGPCVKSEPAPPACEEYVQPEELQHQPGEPGGDDQDPLMSDMDRSSVAPVQSSMVMSAEAAVAAATVLPSQLGPRSLVRDFFSGEGQDCVCRLCGLTVRLNRQLSTSGLWRHMRLKHPESVQEPTVAPPALDWPDLAAAVAESNWVYGSQSASSAGRC